MTVQRAEKRSPNAALALLRAGVGPETSWHLSHSMFTSCMEMENFHHSPSLAETTELNFVSVDREGLAEISGQTAPRSLALSEVSSELSNAG